jgi:small subunit ribosomal protein S3e
MSGDGKRVKRINTKKKFVADGVFQAELNEFLERTLGMEGYAGIEVRATSMSTEIRIKATKAKEILEKSGRKVRELKSLIEKRYNFNDVDNKVELSIKPLAYDRNLCASAQAENLKYKLLSGTPVRLAANNILASVMRRGGAIGCEIIISGKIRGQRAKSQKYKQGYIVSTGQPKLEFVDVAVRHVELDEFSDPDVLDFVVAEVSERSDDRATRRIVDTGLQRDVYARTHAFAPATASD